MDPAKARPDGLAMKLEITGAMYTGRSEFTDQKTGELRVMHGLAWFGGFKRFMGEDHPLGKLKPNSVVDIRCDAVLSGTAIKMLDGIKIEKIYG